MAKRKPYFKGALGMPKLPKELRRPKLKKVWVKRWNRYTRGDE